MSEPLTVPTHFPDISELAEGFVDRVDEQRLILYGPSAYEEGEQIEFAILLVDGTPALRGTARVAAAIDGGEERTAETRYDIVLDSLELDGHAEVVYERILISRDSAVRGDPMTGEVALDEVQDEGGGAIEGEATVVADVGEEGEEAAAPPAEAPVQEPAADVTQHEMHLQDAPADAELAEQPDAHVPGDTVAAEPVQHEEAPPELDAEPATAEAPAGYEEGLPFDQTAVHEPLEPEETAAAEPAGSGPPAAAEPQGFGRETTGEVGLEDVEEVAVGDELPGEATAAAIEGPGGEPVAPLAEPAAAPPTKPPPEPPQAPGGFAVGGAGGNGSVLTRPSYERSWMPAAVPPPEPEASSGLFAHSGGLPIPAASPRPDLDPSLRVSPAPRPQNGAETAQSISSEATAASAPPAAAPEPALPGSPTGIEPAPPELGLDGEPGATPDDLTDAALDVSELGGEELEEMGVEPGAAEDATQHQMELPDEEGGSEPPRDG